MRFERAPDHLLWESAFSVAVAEIYGRPFKLQQMQMLGQYTFVEFEVTPEHYDADAFNRAAEAIAEWQEQWTVLNATDKADWHKNLEAEREHFLDLELLVIDLYARDVLPAGSYMMKVWW